MSDLHSFPLLGRDLPMIPAVPPERAKIRRVMTLIGYGWEWEHRCRWKGYALTNSYPLPSWERALKGALEHVKECR